MNVDEAIEFARKTYWEGGAGNVLAKEVERLNKNGAEAWAEVASLRADLSDFRDAVDEAFGPFPVMTNAEAVKNMTEGHLKLRQDYERLRAENTELQERIADLTHEDPTI